MNQRHTADLQASRRRGLQAGRELKTRGLYWSTLSFSSAFPPRRRRFSDVSACRSLRPISRAGGRNRRSSGKTQKIYEKSLAQRAGAPPFVFYEGPPTANGLPHPGHCLTRAIKDLFPRYRTMRGYLCERKAGWDTHGLPVEVEVCKELGIHSKEEIEAYGVEPFIHKCQESVLRYTQEWERLTERLGFWIDLDEAYVTYHQSYVESVWWALKNLFDRGLLYQGHKIVWWWAQGGTALSSRRSRARAIAKWPTRACMCSFRCWTTTAKPTDTSACWSGRPRPGRCRAISSPPCIPSLEYSVVVDEETGEQADSSPSALVETIADESRSAS